MSSFRAALIALASWFPFAGGAEVFPEAEWDHLEPEVLGIDRARLAAARDVASAGGGSGLVVYAGYLVYAWGDPHTRYDIKSSTKSIAATTLGLAMLDGLLTLDDRADPAHPGFALPPVSNQSTGWIDAITLGHLGTHSAGFSKSGGYTALGFEPGSAWAYSDGGVNWLAEIVTLAYGQDLLTVLRERILTPIGVAPADLSWRKHAYRPEWIEGIKRREFGSGINASVDAMARIGLLHLREGFWEGAQLLPASFMQRVSQPDPLLADIEPRDPLKYVNATDHYGLLWWNNADAAIPGVPPDAYFAWGLYDSLIVVVPSLELVFVRAGPDGWTISSDTAELESFFAPITEAVALPEPPTATSWLASLLLLYALERRRSAAARPVSPNRAPDPA